MPRYVAFLRAINVGDRRLKMDSLTTAFEELGFDDVSTFIASGNVIFRSASRSPEKLATKLEQDLEPRLGFFAETFVRSVAELLKLTTDLKAEPKRGFIETNVGFLAESLDADQCKALTGRRWRPTTTRSTCGIKRSCGAAG